MKRFLLSAAILSCASALYAFTVTPEIAATGFNTVVVTTVGGELPVCTEIAAPEGSWGVGITDVNKVPGEVEVVSPDGTVVFSSGPYEKKESGMTIKVRGNTSARFDKKPYKIKLEKKGDLLCRGDKSLNDKNWVLLTSANNLYEQGFLIGKWIGMPWAPAYEYVHLVMNDEYRGVYLLAEAVERNEKCRIITDDSGFVAERDAYWWNEGGEFLPSCWNPQFNWTLKYPDFEDLTPATTDYISGVLADFERILDTEDYESIIDIDSYARWVLAQDILGTSDGGGTNFYLAKADDSPGSKLFVPVLWDVDSGEETENAWSAVHSQPNVSLLFNNTNTAFRRLYIKLYRELAPTVFGNIEALVASLRSGEWDGFNKAAELNNRVWGERGLYTAAHNAADMEWWYPARRLWLDAAVAALETELGESGVREPAAIGADTGVEVFTPAGVKVYSGSYGAFSPERRGVYIVRSESGSRRIIR